MSGAAEFALEIDQAWLKEQADIHTAVRKIGLEAISKVVKKSPVGDPTQWDAAFKVAGEKLGWFTEHYVGGRFRANWTLSFGGMDGTTTEAHDKIGEATIARLSGEMDTYPTEGYPVIYLQNNLPYAERLEAGYSKQAPSGMVAISIVELAAIWEAQNE